MNRQETSQETRGRFVLRGQGTCVESAITPERIFAFSASVETPAFPPPEREQERERARERESKRAREREGERARERESERAREQEKLSLCSMTALIA